jgi:glycosyltransferase involved in cell wall biosynthesis
MVARQFFPIIGGTEVQAQTLSFGLLRKGVATEVVTRRFSKEWPTVEYITNSDDATQASLKVNRLPAPCIQAIGTFIYFIRLVIFLVFHIRQFDIIHIQRADAEVIVGAVVAKLFGKKTLCKIACSGEGGEIAALRQRRVKKLYLFALRHLDRVVAVSRDVRVELEEFGLQPNSIDDIPNGVDITRFKPLPVQMRVQVRTSLGWANDRVIVSMGRLAPQKGFDVLISAIRLIKDRHKDRDLKLVIVGEGPLLGQLRGQVESLGMLDSVIFTGQVNEVVTYLQAADIFVLPSRFEGLSNALLEAMACGLPVIASRVSGNVDVIQANFNGLLVEPDSVDELATVIGRLVRDRALSVRLGTEARRTIQSHYSLEVVTDRYMTLYQELAGNGTC